MSLCLPVDFRRLGSRKGPGIRSENNDIGTLSLTSRVMKLSLRMVYGDVAGVKVVLLVGVEAATPSNDSSYKNPGKRETKKQNWVKGKYLNPVWEITVMVFLANSWSI